MTPDKTSDDEFLKGCEREMKKLGFVSSDKVQLLLQMVREREREATEWEVALEVKDKQLEDARKEISITTHINDCLCETADNMYKRSQIIVETNNQLTKERDEARAEVFELRRKLGEG